MMKKAFFNISLSLLFCPVLANQIVMPQDAMAPLKTKLIDEPDMMYEDEVFDFLDIDELVEQQQEVSQQDNTQPWYIAFAAKIGTPIFSLYYTLSSWWSKKKGAAKKYPIDKNSYLKQF